MRTIRTLNLLTIIGAVALCQPSEAKGVKKEKAVEAKVCPKELTKAQIGDLMTNKKVTIAGQEFNVGPKFDRYAGKRYMNLNKEGKAPDTVALNNEKARGEQVNCMYMYEFKAASKKDSGKEVDRKGRIKMFTKKSGVKAEAAPKVEAAAVEKKS